MRTLAEHFGLLMKQGEIEEGEKVEEIDEMKRNDRELRKFDDGVYVLLEAEFGYPSLRFNRFNRDARSVYNGNTLAVNIFCLFRCLSVWLVGRLVGCLSLVVLLLLFFLKKSTSESCQSLELEIVTIVCH